jgi:hypothetical protein
MVRIKKVAGPKHEATIVSLSIPEPTIGDMEDLIFPVLVPSLSTFCPADDYHSSSRTSITPFNLSPELALPQG